MNKIYVDYNKCKTCCECINICRFEVLGINQGKIKAIDFDKCTYCEDCVDICPKDAIKIEYEVLK